MSTLSIQTPTLIHEAMLRDQADSKQQPDWSGLETEHWTMQLNRLSEGKVPSRERVYWMKAFRQWLGGHVATIADDRADGDVQACLALMRNVAYELADWGLIIHLHEVLDATTVPLPGQALTQPQTIEYLQLLVAYWQMGQLDHAESFFQSKQPLLGADSPLLGLHQQISQDMARLPPQLQNISDDQLQLCLLEEQHLGGFSWVYDDPQIARLCNLPNFDSDDKWFDWLDSYQGQGDQLLMAVNHREWGLIGSVFIAVHQGVGFFYYWLGQDFQGKGFGPRAVQLLLEFGKTRLAMNCCYGKAYQDNMPSRLAMEKMGFKALDLTLAPPYQTQMYFYLGEQKTATTQCLELRQLITDMGFDDQIEGP